MRSPYRETALTFDCGAESLVGIVTSPGEDTATGVIVVVGGPQYRVGSHRQFVLLARDLAAAGVACLRFDYRGMGDSAGPRVTFESVDDDVAAAVAAFRRQLPALRRIVLWGLCDGATASVFFAARRSDVAGLVLLNPWVRTVAGESGAMLSRYYPRRILSAAFWAKVASGRVDWPASLRSGLAYVRGAWFNAGAGARDSHPLPERFGAALAGFTAPVLIVLSGRDHVAAEFRAALASAPELGGAAGRANVRVVDVVEADHTFSSAAWRSRVASATVDWLRTAMPAP